ncbi:MAG: hypothetical protein KDK25_07910 [Leptospiraceae bacterium]|nr:hypothetical protein [Leptospiraceae bacterium]
MDSVFSKLEWAAIRGPGLALLMVLSLMGGPLKARTYTLDSGAGGIHSFSASPSPDFRFGGSARWLFSGPGFRSFSEPGAPILYGIDLSLALNLGSSTIEHPARPAATYHRFRTDSEIESAGFQKDTGSALSHVPAIYVGYRIRTADPLAFFRGRSDDVPVLRIALGRYPWKSKIQQWLMASPGHFAGLHLIWDTGGFGKMVLSPGYLLDSPSLALKPWQSKYASFRSSKRMLRTGQWNSARYGGSSFYVFGRKWQFGLGFRNHVMRRNSRLYVPGNLHYLQAFLGYDGGWLQMGLGYSRSAGKLQRKRKSIQEERQKDSDQFQPVPRTGGIRKERPSRVEGAEIHGFLRLHRPDWGFTVSFFLPEPHQLSGEEKKRNEEETTGYVHPGKDPFRLPLTQFYNIRSAARICRHGDGKHCSGIQGSPIHARLFTSAWIAWDQYRARITLLYSSPRNPASGGLRNSSPDPDSPDYLEAQLRIAGKIDAGDRTMDVHITYGRIYIRKTRPSRAFGEFLKLGMSTKFTNESIGEGSH